MLRLFGTKTPSPKTPEDWFESAKNRYRQIYQSPFSDERMPMYIQATADAIAYLDKAIDLKPNFVEAWFAKACLHKSMAHHEKALACCETAIRLDPSHARALLCMGNSKWEDGDVEGALEFYRRATKADPNDAAAWCQLAATLDDMEGSADEAQEAWEHVRRLRPDLAGSKADMQSLLDVDPWLERFL